jgi:hypothetical protein
MRGRTYKILAAAMLCAVLAPGVRAATSNVMVMGEDSEERGTGADTVAVARDTRVFRQVLDAISDALTQDGFNVFDERAVTLDNFKQNRVGRGEAELLDIARSVQRPPMDAVVIFTAYAGARKLDYTTDVYTRIVGHVLNVRTGQKLGGFEVTSPRGWKAPTGCERDCLLEVIGKNAKAMAGDLGSVLSQQITVAIAENKSHAPAGAPAGALPTAYTMVFAGFSPEEVSDIEEYLVAFKGYKLHRPVAASPRTVQYWYEIDSDSARLNRNLRMMLDRVGAEGRITFSSTDNTFTVEKMPVTKTQVAR